MNNTSRRTCCRWVRNCALPLVLVVALTSAAQWHAVAHAQSPQQPAAAAPGPKWAEVRIDLPVSSRLLPPGEGAEIANSQCLICHSSEMVLTQPPLTLEQWTAEIGKMRAAYGAPLPVEQVSLLATYLHGINGR
ncbi:MAG: c-type cytochrome [Steroidobacteraceae bacterium]